MMHKKEQQERLKHHLEALRIEQGIVEEVDSDEIEAGDSEFEHKDTAKISVLEGENTLTTVTVTENLDLEDLSDEDRAFGGSTCSAKVARVNRATATPELQSSLSLTVPKKKAKTKPAPSSRSAKSKRITKFKSKKPPRK
ncbi:hypothetical protein EV182_006595 [Spiromyces aspiralis]|uniref:Uncharacterized protein n=1 Tax=Spiromyces aspiralis TaxID=68401 RepID=A0ACC1HEH3_9FUNG|nr:hypothetical protein EV182_006595 [Spiromyces aspiralis]